MAELIDRNLLKKNIAKWLIGGDPQETEMVKLDDIAVSVIMEIEEQPTTTEAEIRAKAIDEFAEKFVFQAVCQGCSGCCNCYELGRQKQCGEYQRYMEIAEQLKGE